MELLPNTQAAVPPDYVHVVGIVPHTSRGFYAYKNTSVRVAIRKGGRLALPPDQAEFFILTHKVKRVDAPVPQTNVRKASAEELAEAAALKAEYEVGARLKAAEQEAAKRMEELEARLKAKEEELAAKEAALEATAQKEDKPKRTTRAKAK